MLLVSDDRFGLLPVNSDLRLGALAAHQLRANKTRVDQLVAYRLQPRAGRCQLHASVLQIEQDALAMLIGELVELGA